MTRRRLWASLLGCVGITVVLLLVNIGLGNTPALGLDLQGGVSVVLAPEKGASSGDLLVIRDLIRSELENRGIAEPDVRVEGSNIIVDLPGVKDQRQALDAVDVAGIVTLRPVLACSAPNPSGATTTTAPGGSTTTTAPGATTTAAPTTTGLGATTTTGAPAGFGHAAPAAGRLDSYQRPQQTPTTGAPTSSPPPTTAAGATPTTSPTSAAGTTPSSTPSGTSTTLPAGGPATATSQDGQTVLRALNGAQCLVGPSGGSGQVFSRDSAKVELTQQQGWTVVVGLSGSGEAAWNALASECFNGTEACPTKQLAIVLDDVIQSYPVVQEPVFQGNVSISGSFKESEARSLSRVLNRGAFPAKVNAQRVDTVSPTLGKDSLKASLFAGLVGVALLVAGLLLFYRRLTLLIAMGMAVWGMLIYSIAVYISQTTNYALTLAGVTGIIVSIGMTVDSYVVYFERMKDEVLHGRTFKNSAARSFRSTWKTILAANLVSFIAAAVLFVLSVGSVRGFALYLGVTTICDVIVLWFFTRPAVILMAESGRLDGHDPFGIGPMPEVVPPPPPPAPAPGGGGS
jgi:preprotein translocase subunit SecD